MNSGLVRLFLAVVFASLVACGGGDGGAVFGSGEQEDSVTDEITGDDDKTDLSDGEDSSSSSGRIDSVAVAPGAGSIVADGTSATTIRARILDTGGIPIYGLTVNFTTTAGTLSASSTTTDTDGYAEVTLVSSTNTGTAKVIADAGGFTGDTEVSFEPGAPDEILLSVSPTILAPWGDLSISAAVNDAHDNRISNTRVSLLLYDPADPDTVINSLEEETGDDGVLNTTLNVLGSTGDRVLEVSVINEVQNTQSVTVTDTAAIIGDVTLISGDDSIVADGDKTTLLRATVVDHNGNGISGATVQFSTSAGTLVDLNNNGANSATTDSNGIAELYLQAPVDAGNATVSAAYGGFNPAVQVAFVPGEPDPSNSSLIASPNTIPADGTTVTTVTAVLADSQGNLVANGTSVTLSASAGEITTTNPTTTTSGRAVFELQAPESTTLINLSIAEYAGITGTVSAGTTSTGEPANIEVSAESQEIYVAGVGEVAGTTMTVVVTDSAGNRIADADDGVNNLRIGFVTHPNGGEYLIGRNADDMVTTTSNSTPISVRTEGGEAAFGLQSGTLPGTVEIQIEALDSSGSALSPGVIALVPQISIASGPAHTIAMTWPIRDAVEDLGGIYKRIGRATVTDRYGNPVPDGTTINLGVVDSVIVEGNGGEVRTANTTTPNQLYDVSPQLTDGTSVGFDTASITRNDTDRFVQAGDRALLLNARAEDKSRHVRSISNTLTDVQSDYLNANQTNLDYIIGAALLGGEIKGVNAQTGDETRGTATTVDGTITYYLLYPADANTILTGCGLAVADDRNPPDNSGDVYVLAASRDNSATTISTGGCFSAIAPVELTATPTTISVFGAGDYQIGLELTDNSTDGQGVALPGMPIAAVVSSVERGEGQCSDLIQESRKDCEGEGEVWQDNDFAVTATGCNTRTDGSGACAGTLSVSGTVFNKGDTAEVQFWSGTSNSVTVTVNYVE
ncbi:Ig-like domain-containing protein [Thiohalomonas denitrificans]|nr:invasin domain 3-containing protein [Thiohalomonas denitrificans]